MKVVTLISILKTFNLAFVAKPFLLLLSVISLNTMSQQLPIFTIDNVNYVGAFRIPIHEFGQSRIAYSQGTIAVAEDGQSFYVVGHTHHQAIAQFSIPDLHSSRDLTDLNFAQNIQPFERVLHRSATGNSQNINRITGLKALEGRLLVNTMEYYDADGSVSDTTLVISDSANIENSAVEGFFRLDGRAHAAGWISDIPGSWRHLFDATHIAGNASNFPINSRLSIGPTAFSFFPYEIFPSEISQGRIPALPLLDFSLSDPLHADRYNHSRTNDLWTEVSEAFFGFIIPGTSTYLVVGNSGGHNHGIGYKITQDNGNVCGGPCSYVASDNYNYYWMWDVNDFVRVKNGELASHDMQPYEYGVFDSKRHWWKMIGADYNSSDKMLYVLYAYRDKLQSAFESGPLMVAYKVEAKIDQIIEPPAPPVCRTVTICN